jgi:rfaE bifunctional protein nucleotidyltransferase chain/domain
MMTDAAANHLHERIWSWEQAQTMRAQWRAQGLRTVFTNGCFDILHAGHVSLLQGARDLGDRLIVGLNADASVRRLKGNERPINGQGDRALVLAALRAVDGVVVFDQDTPLELLEMLRPEVLVKGGDYAAAEVVGAGQVLADGGEVIILPLVAGRATTKVIAKIRR